MEEEPIRFGRVPVLYTIRYALHVRFLTRTCSNGRCRLKYNGDAHKIHRCVLSPVTCRGNSTHHWRDPSACLFPRVTETRCVAWEVSVVVYESATIHVTPGLIACGAPQCPRCCNSSCTGSTRSSCHHIAPSRVSRTSWGICTGPTSTCRAPLYRSPFRMCCECKANRTSTQAPTSVPLIPSLGCMQQFLRGTLRVRSILHIRCAPPDRVPPILSVRQVRRQAQVDFG